MSLRIGISAAPLTASGPGYQRDSATAHSALLKHHQQSRIAQRISIEGIASADWCNSAPRDRTAHYSQRTAQRVARSYQNRIAQRIKIEH
jgi:hypothetical protein